MKVVVVTDVVVAAVIDAFIVVVAALRSVSAVSVHTAAPFYTDDTYVHSFLLMHLAVQFYTYIHTYTLLITRLMYHYHRLCYVCECF